jgi:hypothetical protein
MSPHDTVQMPAAPQGYVYTPGRWQGGRARLWAFQAAHCQLTIRIERRGERGNLHVICPEPEFLHGPVQCEDCCFEVHVEADKPGGGYVLQDARADFAGQTGETEVKENDQPLA